MNLKNPIFITGTVAFLLVVGLAWNYTEVIKKKNLLEEERMASENYLKQAQLEQAAKEMKARIEQDKLELDATIKADKEAQERQLQADKEAMEIKEKADAKAKEQANYNAMVEKYREECKDLQEKNIEQYEKFLNTCTRYNSLEFCDNSPAGKLYADDFTPNWVQDCIESKLKTGW